MRQGNGMVAGGALDDKLGGKYVSTGGNRRPSIVLRMLTQVTMSFCVKHSMSLIRGLRLRLEDDPRAKC
jgi:hypothetical protein